MKIWKTWDSYALRVKRQNSAAAFGKLKFRANIVVRNFMPRYILKGTENPCLYQNLDRIFTVALFMIFEQNNNRFVRQ